MNEQVEVQPASAGLPVDLSSIAAQASAENFPVALRVLPRRPRQHLAAVYNYARFVDDIGDEAAGDRLALLDAVAADVHRLYDGQPELSPVLGLRPVVEECAVPPEPLLDLIEANRIDQRRSSYQTFDDLLAYCRYSANPVGRLVLHIAGAATAANIADSDAVCSGLQVLEHCQDVGEDARAGRVYLPAEELPPDADLRATTTTPEVRAVVARQVERAAELLGPGHRLVRRLSGWPRIAVAGYLAGGLATVDALRAADCDVLARPVVPARSRTLGHALRLWVRP